MHLTINHFLHTSRYPLISIFGPTASGKSARAVELAKQYNGEVISADSRQIYKYMDIGTAKISEEEMQGVPHHMLSIIDPDQNFTVVDFQERATVIISDIHKRGKIPILVGGTGLYVDAITKGLSVPGVEADPEFREACFRVIEEEGPEVLHQKLAKIDPIGAAKIHPNNTHHLIRALEVAEKSGKSKFALAATVEVPYDIHQIEIQIDRAELYDRINQRVLQMFKNGIVEETKKLLKMGYSKDLPSMTSIGYRDIAEMLAGKITQEEVIAKIQQKTRNYAKRQWTWFRRSH